MNEEIETVEIHFQDGSIRYDVVRDRGGNVGLLCPDCKNARWVIDHPVKNWATDEDCQNCVNMKKAGRVEEEQKREEQRLKDLEAAGEEASGVASEEDNG